MKKVRIISMLMFVSIFGVSMYLTGCSDDYTNTENGYSELDSRGGKNGNKGKKGKPDKSSKDLCACINDNFPLEELSDVERSSLEKMREEEKLARDVYLTLYEKWNLNVFNNISKAEQRHMDAILCLMDKYDIEDPAKDKPIGIFVDNDLQSLYNNLIEQGSESVVAAITVGTTIEDLDIFDLMELSKAVDNKDILAVFNNLTKGSRNHMRAFYSQLLSNNGNYTVQFITEDLFENIISSDRERGGSICNNSSSNGRKGNKGRGRKGRR